MLWGFPGMKFGRGLATFISRDRCSNTDPSCCGDTFPRTIWTEVAKEIRKIVSIIYNRYPVIRKIKHQRQQKLNSDAWYYYLTWYYIQIETSPLQGKTFRFRSMLGIFIVTFSMRQYIATAGMINNYAFQCLRTEGAKLKTFIAIVGFSI